MTAAGAEIQAHGMTDSTSSYRGYQEALKTALDLVRRDRQGLGEQARQIMVHIFHRLGEEHDLTSDYRRKLSAALS